MPDDELARSLDAPSMFANRFYLIRYDVGDARIAFGENTNGDIRYHSAVRMADADAVALRDLLLQHYPLDTDIN